MRARVPLPIAENSHLICGVLQGSHVGSGLDSGGMQRAKHR
jgi:hypothetical protein